jgi:flagellar biosynthetic protein FlhB
MARNDDRTEKPTAKRRKEARQEGRVARTPELAGWLGILVITSLLPTVLRSATGRVTGVVGQVSQVIARPTPAAALAVFESGLTQTFDILLPVVGLLGVLALVANVAQVGFLFATKAAAPTLSRLNPLEGIRRLFSPATVWQLVKELGKLLLVGLFAYRTIDGMVQHLVGTPPVGLGPVLTYTGGELLGLVREVAAGGLVLAIGDYAYQRHRTNKALKMTKQEVKDELRQQQGSPEVKRALRRKARSLTRMRMMAAVAGADVVVTNPTHYAVALRYEPLSGAAPRVVAKGADLVALRIREEAHRHGVPVVEDPPLARAVHAACEVDDLVPRELYVAVARLLAFVFTLPVAVRGSGVVHRRLVSSMTA